MVPVEGANSVVLNCNGDEDADVDMVAEDMPEIVAEDMSDNEEHSEDIALYANDRDDLRYCGTFLRWGMVGASAITTDGEDVSNNLPQTVTLRFLQCLETGDPMSYARQQSILTNARSMGGTARLMHPDIQQHWDYVSAAHERLTQARGRRTTAFLVPLEVQAFLGPDPPQHVSFSCEDVMLTIFRLLVMNPYHKRRTFNWDMKNLSATMITALGNGGSASWMTSKTVAMHFSSHCSLTAYNRTKAVLSQQKVLF